MLQETCWMRPIDTCTGDDHFDDPLFPPMSLAKYPKCPPSSQSKKNSPWNWTLGLPVGESNNREMHEQRQKAMLAG